MTLVSQLHKTMVFDRRARALAIQIALLLPDGAAVLDVGCGDGFIDRLIQEQRPEITIKGIDVMVRPKKHIPVAPFDGRTIPYADNSFDAVMFVDVLHHTENPEVLLSEARRVARTAVILKDHTRDGLLANARLRFMDWVGNAAHGVALPYNYWSEQQWREAFERIGLEPSAWLNQLALYPAPASWFFDSSLHFIACLKPD